MTRSCFIVGAGGHAKVAIRALSAAGVKVRGCFDDDPNKLGAPILDTQVLGRIDDARLSGAAAHLALGGNRIRATLAARLECVWTTAAHPSSLVDARAQVGEGSLICMGALVQVDARIGRHTIINTGAIVEHDCDVGDFVHIAPAAVLAGAVRVGEGAFVGMGARLLPGVQIGPWATIGAGAVVLKDVAAGCTVVGVPACPIETRHASERGAT